MDTFTRPYDRYPGTRPFADNKTDQKLFFGRDREVHELLHQLLSTNLLVVYGKSGLGKTSLLQAGIFPRLRERDFLPLTIRLNDQQQPPLELFFQSIADQCHGNGIDYTPGETTSLWEFFKTVLFLRGESLQVPVLVIDQFEELFTLQDDHRRTAITQELADLASARLPEKIRSMRRERVQLPYSDRRPEVKIALVLREDYLGSMQELTDRIPTILEQRYRLTEFNEEQARVAMEGPALIEDDFFTTNIFRYEQNVADQMITFLQGRGGIIEPFQLQILCQYVEQQVRRQQNLVQSQILVDAAYLGDDLSMERILQRFYRDIVQRVPAKSQRKRVYQMCEEGLLNDRGHRLSIEESELERAYKVNRKTLDALVDVRLLRKEPRLESFYYEISHDSMAQSVVNSRRFRIPKWVWYAGISFIILMLFTFIIQQQNLQIQQQNLQLADLRERFLSDKLAKNFWNKALYERDINRDPLKASHYFMHAAKLTPHPGVANNARLAGTILVQNINLNAILAFDGGIINAGFDADEQGILIQSDNGTTHIWDVQTDVVSPMYKGHTDHVPFKPSKTVLSPNEKYVLTWRDDGAAELRYRDSNTIVTVLSGHEKAIWGAAFHPSGDQILTWSADGTARLWQPGSADVLILNHDGVVRGAIYSPDGHRVLTWSEDGTARIWQSRNGKALIEPLNHNASVHGAAFGPKEEWVLTWSDDQTARLWSITTGTALSPPLYHPGVKGAALSAESRQILTWSPDGVIRIWDYIPNQLLSLPLNRQRRMRRVAFSPDGASILTLSVEGDVQLWDSTTGEALSLPTASQHPFRGAVFTPSAKGLLAWTDDGEIRRWRLATDANRLLPTNETPPAWTGAFSPDRDTWGAVFSPNGKDLLTWGDAGAGTAGLWASRPESLPSITEQGRVKGAIFSPDGEQILTWGLDETVRAWDRLTGTELTPPLNHNSRVRSAQFSPNGNRILTWTVGGSLHLWNRHTRAPMPLTLEGLSAIQGVTFSPDGFRLLTWGKKENLRLWDRETGAALTSSFPRKGEVRHAAFSPDGLRVLILDRKRAIRLWALPDVSHASPKHIDLELEVRTGTQLNDREKLEALSPETWRTKKSAYGISISSLR